jgi:hypothetical protein
MSVCPYLGLRDDPTTSAVFPSERNYCHRVGAPAAILETHQEAYCLSSNHQACPLFVDANLQTGQAIFVPPETNSRRAFLLPGALVLLLMAGLIYLGVNAFLARSAPAAESTAEALAPARTEALPTEQLPATALVPFLPSLAPSATAAWTATLVRPTATASATPAPALLETPIGDNPKLMIHRVAPGESLTSLAVRYGTTEEAIQAVNFVLPLPLWQDWLVVIPLDVSDASGLPRFEVYQVNHDAIPARQLAQQLGIDLALLTRYNACGEDDLLDTGRWVLLPRPRQ